MGQENRLSGPDASHLKLKRIRGTEISYFIVAKDKNVHAGRKGEFGFASIWARAALEAETKLVLPGWSDLATLLSLPTSCRILLARLANRVQLMASAMAANVASSPMEIMDIVHLLGSWEID